MSSTKKLVIIDGKSVFYRGYYAMPNLATPQGQPTSGVFGFAMMGLRILKNLNPDYVIVAWDKSKTNIRARRKLYPLYKAQRKPMPEDLREQIPILRRLFDAFGWPLLEIDDFEADDIMAALSKQAQEKGLHTVLVTSDLDILQAVHGGADPVRSRSPRGGRSRASGRAASNGVEVLALKRGLTNTVRYTPQSFKAEYGLSPEQFIDYKALKGDSSDNVPGVAGIGDKTAKDLIQTYGTLDGVYKNLSKIGDSVRKKLEADKDMAFLSHKLLEIRFDTPVKLDLKSADTKNCSPEAIKQLFNELGFKSLFKELPQSMAEAKKPEDDEPPKLDSKTKAIKITELDSPDSLSKVKLGPKTVIHPLVEIDAKSRLPLIQEALLSPSPKEAYILRGLALADVKKLAQLLNQTELIGHDLKNAYKTWSDLAPGQLFDIDIASFLINPLAYSRGLSDFAETELKISFNAKPDEAPLGEDTAKQLTSVLWQLYERYKKELAKVPSLQRVAREIDFPNVPILAKMERIGVKIDPVYFAKMSKNLTRRIADTQELIYKAAKQEFNIGSPAQLQTVLFETLQLPTTDIKKIKTGYSTGASELDKLRGLHPIINLITEYRELAKLKNTYIDTLPKLVDKHNRLHTTFSQTVTPTGRLSSENPNLQNIPIRSEVGREIRQAFVADKGDVLISADYSQFELRLAAVLADDTNMIHAFNKGIDIHAMTAAEIYNLDDIEMVTADQRRTAKVVNFGILYGLSAHGLAQSTGMSFAKAKEFIDSYFEHRQKLLQYIDSLKHKAHKEGYVETLFGRRRPTPDVKSSNWVVRAAAERAAVNMPMQGTEADLMKMAMIKLDKQLPKDAKMLLQIHDSILVEAPQAKSNAIAKTMKDTMENIYKLPVKLDVDVKVGANWGEL